MTDYNYAEAGNEEANDNNALAQVSSLADHQHQAEARVKAAEKELEAAKASLRDIAEHRFPTLMDELGLTEFTTSNGLKVTVREKIRASIPKAKEAEALAWLDDHDHSSLIKRQFIVDFHKGEDGWAKKFAADLRKRKREVRVNEKKSVHANTLSSFVKEKLEAGEEIPIELFGVFRQRSTKLG